MTTTIPKRTDSQTLWVWGACIVVLAIVVAEYFAAVGLPYFSEDYTQLARAASWTSWKEALNLDLVPLRPFQHLFTYWECHGANRSSAVSRVPGFLLHLGSCFLVLRLARQLGMKPIVAAAAMLLYATYPNSKSLIWTAAIGWPGRQFFMLAALTFYLGYLRRRSTRDALATLLCFALSLGFHQGAFIFPGFAFLLGLIVNARPSGEARASRFGRQLNAPLLLMCAFTVLYLLYAVVFREGRQSGFGGFTTLLASTIKGSLSLFPGGLRTFVLEGLRAGGSGIFVAAGVYMFLMLLPLIAFWKGSVTVRCLLLAIALEILLPVVMVGFNQRYSYFASALVAILLGSYLERGTRKQRIGVSGGLLLLGGLWLADLIRDVRDYAECGRVTREIVETVGHRLTEDGRAFQIAIVNVPVCWGREHDIPAFNWGLRLAVTEHVRDQVGLGHNPTGPNRLLLWRTSVEHSNFGSSDMDMVTQEKVARAVEDPSILVLQYSKETQSLVQLPSQDKAVVDKAE